MGWSATTRFEPIRSRDGRIQEGIATGADDRAKEETTADVASFEGQVKQLLDMRLPLGFAVVRLDPATGFVVTGRGAGQRAMLRLVRQAMMNLGELNSHPQIGVTWRIHWILAELADLGIRLRWISTRLGLLEPDV